jgi:iron complex outermembrane receptor protein
MNIEVTSVSKHPEKLLRAASAIQVITAQEIAHSAALNLAESLRLASNLQVAQANSHDWAISARGFNGAPLANNTLANKLLVMIDGRSIYTPLFGGVFWDVQNILSADLDRIEVVSGPGASLWGANAVNGIINIVRRSARETQGGYISAAGGSFWQDHLAARYGGKLGSRLFYRVYGQRYDRNSTDLRTGPDAQDDWKMTQAGFRADFYPTDANTITLQGDFYKGDEGSPVSTIVNGQNVLGRWTHTFSQKSEVRLQMYFDRTWRNLPAPGFSEDLKTYDFDFQHQFPIGRRHTIVWGTGLRLMEDDVTNTPALSFIKPKRAMHLFSSFAQDQISLIPERLDLTLGSRFEHNVYSGFELQPTARLAWTLNEQHTLWAAVSRAVHSPSRFDTEIAFPVVGDPDFDSEKVDAYELGYRSRPMFALSFSAAAFYNRYHDLRSLVFDAGSFRFVNGHSAETWGIELSANLQALDWWRWRGGYSFLEKDVTAELATVVPTADRIEGLDPSHQFVLQSMMALPRNFELDVVARYADALPSTQLPTARVPAYITLDARVGWSYHSLVFSVVGQHLLEESHREFGTQIPRSVYGKVEWRF